MYFTPTHSSTKPKSGVEKWKIAQLWQHNRGNYTTPNNLSKKRTTVYTFRSTKASANIEHRAGFSHLVGLLGDCRYNKKIKM